MSDTSSTAGAGMTARRAATRTRLLEAAVAVFAREGIRGATVEQISEEAGFTRGAFYSNFEGKNDLITALVASQVDSVREHVEQAVALAREHSGTTGEAGQVGEVVEQAARMFVALQPTTPDLVLTLADLRLEAARSPHLREALAEGLDLVTTTVTGILREVLAEVGLRFSCPPEEALEYLEATWNHVTLAAVTQGQPANSPALARQLTRLLTALTEPVPPPTGPSEPQA